jgi:peptide/nickel transport system substrate-binding protein
MQRQCTMAALVLLAVGLASCAPAPAASGRTTVGIASPDAARPQASRTLVAAVSLEPQDVAVRGLRERGVALFLSKRVFNANLAILDERANAHPYLAEALPQLGTDTWRVLPDGRMETTWRLKPAGAWHDGTPLFAQDYVFAWRVYATPQLGVSGTNPFNAIESVTAPDERTVLIRWSRPYPDAGSLAATNREFAALPPHILEAAFQEQAADAFGNHPYWTRDYVGLGPFRLERWEPGTFIEGAAFDQHVLGRPRIDRLRIVFIGDANAALANLLTGQVQLGADSALGLKQAVSLKREWSASGGSGGGTVLSHPNQYRATAFQFRADLASPRALLDPRVRRALNYALDKEALQQAIYEGEEIPADFIVGPLSQWWPAVERNIARYPYDVRQSERLMSERGFTRGADGFFTSPAEGRYTVELKANATPEGEPESNAMANEWRKSGFDVQQALLPAPLAQDAQLRATFPGMFTFNTNAAEITLLGYGSAAIPSAENRWIGGNRGGWSNPEYDRLIESFNTSLERAERAQQVGEMAKIFTQDLPTISLFFRTQAWAFRSEVSGLVLAAPEAPMPWNIYEWELH